MRKKERGLSENLQTETEREALEEGKTNGTRYREWGDKKDCLFRHWVAREGSTK